MIAVAFSLSLFTCVSMATVVQGACPAGQTFTSAADGYAYVDACAFPTKNLNKSCVSASCPSLTTSKLCPTNSNGTFNNISVITQINSCFSSMSSLCGAQWDPIQFPQNSLKLSFSLLAAFDCSLPPAGLTATGLQRTTLDSISPVPGGPNTFLLSFSSPNVNATGSAHCSFSVFGLPLPISVPFTGGYTASYKSTADIDVAASPPSINVTSARDDNNLSLIPPALGTLLPADVTSAFNGFVKIFIGNASDDVAFSNYGALFVAYALQVLRGNC